MSMQHELIKRVRNIQLSHPARSLVATEFEIAHTSGDGMPMKGGGSNAAIGQVDTTVERHAAEGSPVKVRISQIVGNMDWWPTSPPRRNLICKTLQRQGLQRSLHFNREAVR
jgi:hypothetical protein